MVEGEPKEFTFAVRGATDPQHFGRIMEATQAFVARITGSEIVVEAIDTPEAIEQDILIYKRDLEEYARSRDFDLGVATRTWNALTRPRREKSELGEMINAGRYVSPAAQTRYNNIPDWQVNLSYNLEALSRKNLQVAIEDDRLRRVAGIGPERTMPIVLGVIDQTADRDPIEFKKSDVEN